MDFPHIEVLEFEGKEYQRIDINSIDFAAMTPVYKVADGGSEEDQTNFSDYNYKESTDPHVIFVARVPFNFTITNHEGKYLFMEAGGYIAFDPALSSEEHKHLWVIPSVHGRQADMLERNYTRADDGNDKRIMEVYRNVIMADRSPISGIQFTMKDLAKAHERVGRDLGNLEKYI